MEKLKNKLIIHKIFVISIQLLLQIFIRQEIYCLLIYIDYNISIFNSNILIIYSKNEKYK